jgi:hypothetical protein
MIITRITPILGILLFEILHTYTSYYAILHILFLTFHGNSIQEILQMDLTCCSVYTNLKTLILNKWCVYDDVTAFACLLRHTPTLEKLILQLDFEVRTMFMYSNKLLCASVELYINRYMNLQ